MTDYPILLPKPLIDGYSLKPQDPLARSQIDSGIDQRRRRYVATPEFLAIRFIFTQEDFKIFNDWYKTDINNGMDYFNIDLLRADGLQNTQARFSKPYTARLLAGDIWEIESELETREGLIVSQDIIDAIDIVSPPDGSTEPIDKDLMCELQNRLSICMEDLKTTKKWQVLTFDKKEFCDLEAANLSPCMKDLKTTKKWQVLTFDKQEFCDIEKSNSDCLDELALTKRWELT